MPIYEYRCQDCRKKFERLVLKAADASSLRCRHCGSGNATRLVSRFTSIKSEESRLESLTDPSRLAGLDESDPASMARWLKRMGGELGEDVSRDEIDQMADEIASGKALDEGPGGGNGFEGAGGPSDLSDDTF